MLPITDDVAIDETELSFEFSRSSGPGGQNVNKVETRVTVLFDVAASAGLDDPQKERILTELANRITKDGVLRVTSDVHRTREANRRDALQRFVELLAEALEEKAPRKPTRTPRRAKKRRLEEKRQRGETKRLREPPRLDE